MAKRQHPGLRHSASQTFLLPSGCVCISTKNGVEMLWQWQNTVHHWLCLWLWSVGHSICCGNSRPLLLSLCTFPHVQTLRTCFYELYSAISEQQTNNPDGFFSIAGDFNLAKLKTVLPKFYQHVNFATRGNNTLDFVYTTVKDAYKAEPFPHLGYSDHISVMLISVYRLLLKLAKPVQKQITIWPDNATSATTMKHTTERKWHSLLNGVVLTTCPSMWGRQKRLWWTSGETLLTTPHWQSTAWLWRESAALNSWGCTSQRTSPGPPTPCRSPRRHKSTYTFSAGWKEQVSLHPSSPPSTGEPLRVYWPDALLSDTGTVVQQTARPSSGKWTQL